MATAGIPFDENLGDVYVDKDNVDDGDYLLVEVDGTEASGRGNDAEQVEDPVQLNF